MDKPDKDTTSQKGGKPDPEVAEQMPRRFLNVIDAAAYLGLSKSYLDKKRVSGDGPKFRRHGKRIFYSIEDIDAWSHSRRFDSTSEYNKQS